MESIHIIKNGIENVVDEMQFKNIYKLAGWVKDTKYYPVNQEEEVIKELKSEEKIKNYKKAKKVKAQSFDDNILKKE